MLLLKLIFLSYFFHPIEASSELQQYRQEYQRIHLTETAVTTIISTSKTSTLQGTTAQAYAAAAFLCSAKYKSSPINAYQTFSKGKFLLDAAVKRDTFNIDARFLRYTIQLKAPAFLGYTAACRTDRAFLIMQLPRLRKEDPEMYSIIQAFMLLHDEKAVSLLQAAKNESSKTKL